MLSPCPDPAPTLPCQDSTLALPLHPHPALVCLWNKSTKINPLTLYSTIISHHPGFGHSLWTTGHPVRSAIHKPLYVRPVLEWVTIWEFRVLNLFALANERTERKRSEWVSEEHRFNFLDTPGKSKLNKSELRYSGRFRFWTPQSIKIPSPRHLWPPKCSIYEGNGPNSRDIIPTPQGRVCYHPTLPWNTFSIHGRVCFTRQG